MDYKALQAEIKQDLASMRKATEAQRAAFEAEFNKFLSHLPVGLQESAMDRVLTDETVYLKIRADGPSVEIPACGVEMIQNTYLHHPECHCGYCKDGMSFLPPPQSEHFPGCLCERRIDICAVNPVIVAEMEGSDADHPIATERKTVAEHVADILSDLQFGKCTRGEAVEVGRAAERAIADHDVSRSIGKL